MAEVKHSDLLEKLVEHDQKIVNLSDDIHGINVKLDPIATGVQSMAWGVKVILWLGGISAAIVAILELMEHAV